MHLTVIFFFNSSKHTFNKKNILPISTILQFSLKLHFNYEFIGNLCSPARYIYFKNINMDASQLQQALGRGGPQQPKGADPLAGDKKNNVQK